MFGQFTGEEEPDGGLNFPGSNSRPEKEKIKFVKISRCTPRRPLNVTKSLSFILQARLASSKRAIFSKFCGLHRKS